MFKEIKKVYEWQKLFGRNGHFVSDSPTFISEELAQSRANFLYEEIEEYLNANKDHNIVEVLDALCDILYFLFGMVVIHGLQNYFEQSFDIVHQSNMSKLDKDGNVIFRESDGKILKGENYWKPTERLTNILTTNVPGITCRSSYKD